jgi:two-component system chemotaxis sensor kinase CheA
LAERDEIAVMKDSLKIGFFFMDRGYIIQAHYSRFLEEMLSEQELSGKYFPDLLSASVTGKDLESIKDYFNMIFERTFDQGTLDEINPLGQFNYVNSGAGSRKVFQCDFTTVERGRGETFVLVTVYDITARTELQERLREEETRRQEEMQSIFELIQVEPGVFADFLGDVEFEFDKIERTLKNNDTSAHEALVEVYQSVHAIKSNAVILGLNIFGNKVHKLESKIKILREQEDASFSEMLNLAMELEKLSQEKEGFKATIEKIRSITGGAGAGKGQGEHVLVESLAKTANKAAADMGKKVQFIVDGIDTGAVEKGPRRVMKEVLIQLIRNAVAHGIESPGERLGKGKGEAGAIRLSIKLSDGKIHVRLGDDGRGLDFGKIRERAEQMKLIRKEDGDKRDILIKAIFAPGFSTAEKEGLHAGRGIGLNLVRDRVRDVKGTIKLQSEPDKGTVFNIFIPITNNELENKAS